MLSSKSDAKQETRFAARLDVLMERMDTLASTVATTASSIAKKDGEIAALRRDLEARDQTLQTLATQVRQSGQSPESSPAADGNELRSLRNAVAALTKERAEGGNATQVEELATKVRALATRIEELAASVDARPADRPSEELVAMLATLRSQVEALGGLTSGVSEEQVDRRFGDMDDALAGFAQRLDTLAGTVEEATDSLRDKELELAALNRHFTESSTRIESIVDDIRDALHAFGELDSTALDELAARIERMEAATRDAADARDRGSVELTRRVDRIEQRVVSVAEEVARAKTLWPVALRSLEARLEDAVHPRHAEPGEDEDDTRSPVAARAEEPSEDLLAGLRDSLQAMESVAAEMARASDTLGEPAGEQANEPSDESEPDDDSSDRPELADEQSAAAGAGATIVPLRASEP